MTNSMSRRNLVNEEIFRKWHGLSVNRDMGTFDSLLADNFIFLSAAGDGSISECAFKMPILGIQVTFICHFDLKRTTEAEDAFLKIFATRPTANPSETSSISKSRLGVSDHSSVTS